MIRHHRVADGVGFVEGVTGERFHQVENFVGLLFRNAVFSRAAQKVFALLHHHFFFLFAHRAAQQVGLSQRVARNNLRDLHHLILIHDDAVCFVQQFLQFFVRVFDLFQPVLTPHEAGNVRHRAGTIQGYHSRHIAYARRLQLLNVPAHLRRFQLEHAHALAVAQQFVGFAHVLAIAFQWQFTHI